MATWNPAVTGPARPGTLPQRGRRKPGERGLRARGCLTLLWLGCMLAAGAYGLTLLLPAWVKAAGGSPAQAGLIYWYGALGAGGALLFGGRLAERSGTGWAAATGCGLYAAAAGILASTNAPGGGVYAAGVLLGAGWALFFTSAPVTAAQLPGAAPAGTRFLVLAGCNAAGMGTTPIAGQLLLDHGVPYRSLFTLAALASLAAAGLFSLLAATVRPQAAVAPGGIAARGMIGPARLLLTSGARRFLVMVLLGACVFTTMTTYQATLAASMGVDSSVFYACYTAGVIIPRFTATRMLGRLRPAPATTALLAGMCASLAGFLFAGHDLAIYAASSALLGVSYGLAYPLIQAQAADSVPGQLRHWALWYFSLAYFAGLYGFPLIAGAITALGGCQALTACLLVIAALELAVSATPRQRAPLAMTRRTQATSTGWHSSPRPAESGCAPGAWAATAGPGSDSPSR